MGWRSWSCQVKGSQGHDLLAAGSRMTRAGEGAGDQRAGVVRGEQNTP